MTPTSLRRWLERARPRAAALELSALRLASDYQVVRRWEEGEICGAADPVAEIFDTCSDFCDQAGESVQFRLQWVTAEGKAVATSVHRHAPTDSESGDPGTEADLSTNRIIAQFMRHDELREKLFIGAIGSVFSAQERTIALQQKMLEASLTQQSTLLQQMQAIREQGEGEVAQTEEERTESLARATAWNKAAELFPVIVEAVIEHGGKNGRSVQ